MRVSTFLPTLRAGPGKNNRDLGDLLKTGTFAITDRLAEPAAAVVV
jgi:hypothetical protein